MNRYYSAFPLSALFLLAFSGTAHSQFAGGDGTPDSPWQIQTAEQLHNVRDHLSAHFILVDDIDLGIAPWNEENGWEAIGIYIDWNDPDNAPFTGTLDGDGHTISGLYIYRPDEDHQGLFADTEGALIKNVTLADIDITGQNNVGGLAGRNVEGTISGVYASGVLNGHTSVGALVGEIRQQGAIITDSHASADVTGEYAVGGLAGRVTADARIDRSHADGNVTGTGEGLTYAGGLAGLVNLRSSISTSHATGDVTGTGNRVGGLAGSYNPGRGYDLVNCYATGNVTGVWRVGGLVGYLHNSKIADSYATGDVDGESFIGGLVGDSDNGEIIYYPTSYWRHQTFASGNVTGSGGLGQIGGLVGSNRGSIIRAFATGSVDGDVRVGGLAGVNSSYAIIENSYATGSVKGDNMVGGLVGHNTEANRRSGKITNSYAVGKVFDADQAGGLVGLNDGDSSENVIDSYYDIEKTEQDESDGGYGRTTDEMTYPYAEGVFANWNFEHTWIHDTDHSVNNGYPHMSMQDTDTYVSDPGPHEDTALEIRLSQNHPNPFNPTTRISFSLTEAADVRLEIFDMLGRRVALLVNERRQAGRHTVDFDASGLSSGVYISRLQVGGYFAAGVGMDNDSRVGHNQGLTGRNPARKVLTRTMTLVK